MKGYGVLMESESIERENLLELRPEVISHLKSVPGGNVFNFAGEEVNGKEYIAVDLIDPNTLTYQEFFEKYLITNRPCLFTEGLTRDWNSRKYWIKETDGENSQIDIDFDYLSMKYGTNRVDVTDCSAPLLDYANPNCKIMSLDSFLAYWKEYRDGKYDSSMPCLYLKDWHIMKNFAKDRNGTEMTEITDDKPYKTPIYFVSDWLNESCIGSDDDFKFTYMGPKGTWTPFHCDVYGSYSWSANIIGTKKWHIYPPGKETRFRNLKTQQLEYDFQNPGLEGVDYFEIIQEMGQVIFVPSGWHHIVWNLADTISINHNWMNGVNASFIWKNLKSALDDVEKELDDLKEIDDFPELCQNLLRANHGMNYTGFKDILFKILENRRNPVHLVDGLYQVGVNHRQFDVLCAKNAIRLLRQDKRYSLSKTKLNFLEDF